MNQNRSSAVMQQRREPHDSLDYFPTPPWATRALCERLEVLAPGTLGACWEPACGEGHMALPLREYFGRVFASDVHDYSGAFPAQNAVCDFLCDWDHPVQFLDGPEFGPDWIITNPPFRLGEEFIHTALTRAKFGVAVLVRSAFLEGQERHRSLFSSLRPSLVLQFVERVPMVKGRLDQDASTATSYCWVVWMGRGANLTEFDWLSPCRSRLERDTDYPKPDVALAPAPLFDGCGP